MFTRSFWIASLERAVKTLAQVLLAVGGADLVNVIATDWWGVLATALSAVVFSFLTSIASSKTGPEPSPALFGKEAIPAAHPTDEGLEADYEAAAEVEVSDFNEPVGILEPVEAPKPKRKPRKKAV